jgi:hypothetical protein
LEPAPAIAGAAPELGRPKLEQRPQLTRAAERVRNRVPCGQGDRGQQSPLDLDTEQLPLGPGARVELHQAVDLVPIAGPEAADADPVVEDGRGHVIGAHLVTSWSAFRSYLRNGRDPLPREVTSLPRTPNKRNRKSF